MNNKIERLTAGTFVLSSMILLLGWGQDKGRAIIHH